MLGGWGWWIMGLLAATPLAPDTATRVLPATKIPTAAERPRIDGRLDDPIWQRASVATDFVQERPQPGEPARARTEVRVAVDAAALYVAARLFDAPDSMAAPLGPRDATGIPSDWFDVIVDSYHDRRTAFRFSVNPRGVQKDVLHYDDVREDLSWDAVWEAATQADSTGWTVELRIPLSQLRFRPGQTTWGINFRRVRARSDEVSYWAPVLPNQGRFVSFAGILTGVEGLAPRGGPELLPYTAVAAVRRPRAALDPLRPRHEATPRVGFDLKVPLTSAVTANVTVNPDFGQVEADPAYVNLTAFEVFLPEKRPFFLEGTQIFRFSVGLGDGGIGNDALFYSRRIGRPPQRTPGGLARMPEATTILAASKLSGQVGRGWTLGALQALTAREEAEVLTPEGRRRTPVEPLTHYAVLRAQRTLRDGAAGFGGILTATNRFWNATDSLDFLPRAAYGLGLEGYRRFAANTMRVEARLAGTWVLGDSLALLRLQRSAVHNFGRPDASHLRLNPNARSMRGWAGTFALERIGGGSWRWGALALARTPGFEPNDLGFVTLVDVLGGALYVNRFTVRPTRWTRSWNVGMTTSALFSWGGERLGLELNTNGNVQWANLWTSYAGLGTEGWALDRAALRGGPALRTPASVYGYLGTATDPRRRLQGSVSVDGRRERGSDGWSLRGELGLTWRPAPQFSLRAEPSASRRWHPWQYVPVRSLDGRPRYVVAGLDQRTVALTLRGTYVLSPRLSVQLYAEPFASTGRYRDLRAVADPRAPRFAKRFPLVARRFEDLPFRDAGGVRLYRADTDGDGQPDVELSRPDFLVRQLALNLVTRWDVRPGSTLFVVWTQNRAGTLVGDAVPTWDPADAFARLGGLRPGLPPTHALLVKLTVWMGR